LRGTREQAPLQSSLDIKNEIKKGPLSGKDHNSLIKVIGRDRFVKAFKGHPEKPTPNRPLEGGIRNSRGSHDDSKKKRRD